MQNDDHKKDETSSDKLPLQDDDELPRSGRGGRRAGAGRKPVRLDLEVIEKLAAIGCPNEEIAAVCSCSVRTLETYLKQPEFAAAKARGSATAQISLRRWQWKAAEKGDTRMLIFLGKQYLGQQDELPSDGRFVAPSPYRRSMVPKTRLAVEQAEALERQEESEAEAAKAAKAAEAAARAREEAGDPFENGNSPIRFGAGRAKS